LESWAAVVPPNAKFPVFPVFVEGGWVNCSKYFLTL
jgi:hypothetical protein